LVDLKTCQSQAVDRVFQRIWYNTNYFIWNLNKIGNIN